MCRSDRGTQPSLPLFHRGGDHRQHEHVFVLHFARHRIRKHVVAAEDRDDCRFGIERVEAASFEAFDKLFGVYP